MTLLAHYPFKSFWTASLFFANLRFVLREREREARVVTIRKTTNGHHQLALALMHHGVRKNKMSRKKKKSVKKL